MKKDILVFLFIATFFLLSFRPQIITLSPPDFFTDCLDLPTTPFNYSIIDLPNYLQNELQEEDNTPAFNPITDEGATLGRVLFYDKKLSANDEISCASCHPQELAFSDPDQFSTGFEGGLTPRNSMNLSNARFYENGHFFWDERAATLEEQVLLPIQDDVEMGMNLADLEAKLTATDYYPDLFNAAFGTPSVSSERIALALSQFVRSLISYESKYDVGRAQVGGGGGGGAQLMPFPNFTDEENEGKDIFFRQERGNCASCHQGDLQTGTVARNNGLFLMYADQGVGAITGQQNDNGKFKVPSLRNIELTAPYMHDGSVETLEDVVQHYDNGVLPHPNLAPQLRVDGPGSAPRNLGLTFAEKDALVAFLKTLTDTVFTTAERFSDPFCLDTNTEEVALQSQVKVFPNPFSMSTKIRIVGDWQLFKRLEIANMNGQVLFFQNVDNEVVEVFRNDLTSGVYFMKLIGEEQQIVKRIVIQ
jgi:cytochrome c peroxidase